MVILAERTGVVRRGLTNGGGAAWAVEQGRTLHSLVSICSRQAGFWLETRVETPAPQLWEQGLQRVLFSGQVVLGGTSLFRG